MGNTVGRSDAFEETVLLNESLIVNSEAEFVFKVSLFSNFMHGYQYVCMSLFFVFAKHVITDCLFK